MEEGNQSGDLAINGGHGNAQEEYAMRRRRRRRRDEADVIDSSSPSSISTRRHSYSPARKTLPAGCMREYPSRQRDLATWKPCRVDSSPPTVVCPPLSGVIGVTCRPHRTLHKLSWYIRAGGSVPVGREERRSGNSAWFFEYTQLQYIFINNLAARQPDSECTAK